jgi:RNase H-like domain found in reverse transcriptase/Integrase zinc binding domain
MGAILLQEQENEWRTIAYMSETYNLAERNYHTEDRELLAIVKMLKRWRQYLLGRTFEIWSDHKNLQTFRKPQDINRRQAGWIPKLAEYDFTIHHLPGNKNIRADVLSRKDGEENKKGDNKDQVVLPEHLFRALILGVKDNKEEILRRYHDDPLAGHPGVKRMMKELEKDWNWEGMRKDVQEYVKGCVECQKNVNKRNKKMAPLNPLPVTRKPWEKISVDLIGPLPESLTYDAIMVIVDYGTKMKILIPTHMELTAMGTAELFKQHAFKRFGIPEGVVSDRGPQFVSKFMIELYKVLGIKGSPSTAYHPQTDGQTERANQEIETYLRFYVNNQQDDWAKWLDQAEFVLNNRFHEGIQNTPFFLMHGYHPWKGQEKEKVTNVQGVEEWMKELKGARGKAIEALEKAQESMKKYYDRKRVQKNGEAVYADFPEGSKVWLDGTNYKTIRPSKKLSAKKLGPFKILERIGKSAYRLQLPKSWNRVHPVFNEVVLERYHEPTFMSQ